MSEDDEDVLSDASRRDLAKFLSKVDEIGDLVKGLSTSEDKAAVDKAIKKADTYLQGSACSKSESGFSRTVVNTATPVPATASHAQQNPPPVQQESTTEFCLALEEDARERAERRKEKEAAGREWKKRGTRAFREGDVKEAIVCYSKAISEMPWIISLYTNRALCYNKLGQYEDAIKDCDMAISVESGAIRAHVHKGKALAGLRDFSEAGKCYQDALKLNPEPSIRREIQSAQESARLSLIEDAHSVLN